MRTKKMIMILVILLFISGCKGGFMGKKGTDATSVTTEEIYSGKEGLTWKFFENAPPDEVYEDGKILPVGIRLFNKGASDIKSGYLLVWTDNNKLLKLDEDSLLPKEGLSFTDNMIQFDLIGKNKELLDGGSEIITFNFKTGKLSKVENSIKKDVPVKVKITYCYNYQTIVGETVCIDAGSEMTVREKSCEVKVLDFGSQGAPVAVTKVKSEMIPTGGGSSKVIPRFTMLVENVGGGDVVKDEGDIKDACSKAVTNDKIKVNARLSPNDGEKVLKCNNEGIVTLKEKKGTLICSYEEGFEESVGTFSAPIYITLDYGYTKTGWKEVKIKKI